jgi:hypothetical protein
LAVGWISIRGAEVFEDRLTLVRTRRTDRETFYFLTKRADPSQARNVGDELTEPQVRSLLEGKPEHEVSRLIEEARMSQSESER